MAFPVADYETSLSDVATTRTIVSDILLYLVYKSDLSRWSEPLPLKDVLQDIGIDLKKQIIPYIRDQNSNAEMIQQLTILGYNVILQKAGNVQKILLYYNSIDSVADEWILLQEVQENQTYRWTLFPMTLPSSESRFFAPGNPWNFSTLELQELS